MNPAIWTFDEIAEVLGGYGTSGRSSFRSSSSGSSGSSSLSSVHDFVRAGHRCRRRRQRQPITTTKATAAITPAITA
ncbi:hypothetical protein AB0F88_39065 [Streptosporangium sp. NPDC023963]|uniref:hypothetical protein n=1 Tax=Streptosporangium sp. NPDC023963 TaxID=3155608 RepID=UPI00344A1EF8